MFENAVLHTESLGAIGKNEVTHVLTIVVGSDDSEVQAAARRARTIVPVLHSRKDPLIIAGWGRYVGASPGRCGTGATRRESPRVVRSSSLACCAPWCSATPVVTVLRNCSTSPISERSWALLRFAGFEGEHDFPAHIDEFLERQTLVRDPDTVKSCAAPCRRWTGRRHTGPRPHNSDNKL
jgi:hypothetical protein